MPKATHHTFSMPRFVLPAALLALGAGGMEVFAELVEDAAALDDAAAVEVEVERVEPWAVAEEGMVVDGVAVVEAAAEEAAELVIVTREEGTAVEGTAVVWLATAVVPELAEGTMAVVPELAGGTTAVEAAELAGAEG